MTLTAAALATLPYILPGADPAKVERQRANIEAIERKHSEVRALRAAERHGWRFVLLEPRQKFPAKGAPWQVTQDPAEVRAWIHGKGGNVGLLCGKDSGAAVLDFDDMTAYEAMEAELGPLPPTVRTGSGKVHVYFRWRPGLPAKVLWKGRKVGEVQRGPNQQVVAPPSIHPDTGKPYRWIGDPLAELPALPDEWRDHLLGGQEEKPRGGLNARAIGQPGAKRRADGIKFACPACTREGHDKDRDNAKVFLDGQYGCAWAKGQGPEKEEEHRKAIGDALGSSAIEEAKDRKERERQERFLRIRKELENKPLPRLDIPPLVTLRDRLALPRRLKVWCISELQQMGHRVVWAAQFKAGKTSGVCNLTRSLVDGTPFLDTFDVSPVVGTVAVFDFEMLEDDPGQLDDWYRDVGIKANDRVLLVPMRGRARSFDIRPPDIRAEWAKRLRERDVKYLIIDCLRPILDALGLSEHSEVGVFFEALDELLLEAKIHEALVIHHMGHTNERSRGDSRILDWADVNWTIVRESEDPASPRYFKAYGRGVDVAECRLVFNPKTRRLAIQGGTRKEATLEPALQAIVDYLNDQGKPDTTANAVEAALLKEDKHTRAAVRDAVKLGKKRGLLVEAKGEGQRGGTALRLARPRQMSLDDPSNAAKSLEPSPPKEFGGVATRAPHGEPSPPKAAETAGEM